MDVATTYTELMDGLTELPAHVANYQADLNELQLALSLTKRQLDEKRNELIGANGGWSALGKNEAERELAVKTLIKLDKAANALQTNIYTLERDIARASSLVDDYTRRYGAVCYKTRLHSALLIYLGSAGAPVKEVDFGMMGTHSTPPPPQRTNGGNQNSVTEADAKAIGL